VNKGEPFYPGEYVLAVCMRFIANAVDAGYTINIERHIGELPGPYTVWISGESSYVASNDDLFVAIERTIK
jgi:hypothetical protein